jgi:hypothetical protein
MDATVAGTAVVEREEELMTAWEYAEFAPGKATAERDEPIERPKPPVGNETECALMADDNADADGGRVLGP